MSKTYPCTKETKKERKKGKQKSKKTHTHKHKYRDIEDWVGLRNDFYDHLGCSNRSCLYSSTMFEILDAESLCYENTNTNGKTDDIQMIFTPTIIPLSINSTSLLTQQPLLALKSGNFAKKSKKNGESISIINGVNDNEGWAFILSPNMSQVKYNQDLKKLFKNADDEEAVRKEYSIDLSNSTYSNNMALIITDMFFICGNHNATLGMSLNVLNVSNVSNSIYFYHFDGYGEFNEYLSGNAACYQRACHGSELLWVFEPNFGGLEYKGDSQHQVKY